MSARRDRRRTGTTPQGRGRFLGFDVLTQVPTWDRATAGVVLSRLGPHEALRFFTPAEHSTAAALFDRLLDQDGEPRVPVVGSIAVFVGRALIHSGVRRLERSVDSCAGMGGRGGRGTGRCV